MATNFYTLAQNTYRIGVLPSVNFKYDLPADWSINCKLETRHLVQEGTFGGDRKNNYEYVLSDVSLFFAKRVGLNSRLSGGYLFRYREGEIIHRAIQQYTLIQKLTGFRISHRIVTDQTFLTSGAVEYRFRYRLAAEVPLNGLSVDFKEFYLKIGKEYLGSIENSIYDMEIRLIPMIGYSLAENHKIEIGLDYRVNSLINQSPQNSFWTGINWYVDL